MKRKISILLMIILCLSLIATMYNPVQKTHAVDPDPFFNINYLVPNTKPTRSAWAALIADEFKKIGIGTDIYDHTGWAQISPRTWGYPGPYPIPQYSEGGFDNLFIDWTWGIDFDPTGLYETSAMVPNGDNYYNYANTTYDTALDNYINSFDRTTRDYWAEEMQEILYDDLPAIPIVHNKYLVAHDDDLEDWDSHLWVNDIQTMENWSISGQTAFHHAVPVDFEDFSLYHAQSYYDEIWLNQIYTGMVDRNPNDYYHYTPNIITSYETSDGLTYNVQMNPSAKWADGTTINASDVEFSYEIQIDNTYGCGDYGYWSLILDGSSIDIISEFEFNITFLVPYPYQVNNLALGLYPKHVWEGVSGSNFESQAATWAADDVLDANIFGAGPYYLHDYNPGSEIIHLKRNDFYDDWTGITPYFEDIYFEFVSNKVTALAALSAGSIDMVDRQYSVQISEVPVSCNYTLAPGRTYAELSLNMLHPYYGTGASCPIPGEQSAKYVRKAMSHMIPRQLIADEIMDELGGPLASVWPSIAPDYDDQEIYEYNITKAKAYMRLAGFDYDEDFDGLTDSEETDIYGTDPYDSDSDDDGLLDGEEVLTYTTDPLNNDSDTDNLTDWEEVNLGSDGYITDPNDIDTDNDTISDYNEMLLGSDPTDPNDPNPTSTAGFPFFYIGFLSIILFGFMLIFRRKK